MKVKFLKAFSLNGKWFEKGSIVAFNESTAKVLIDRKVVVPEKKSTTKKG